MIRFDVCRSPLLYVASSFSTAFCTLTALFHRTISALTHCFKGQSSSLSSRLIGIAGIQNAGNTCVLSVLIQDLSSETHFTDFMLGKTLRKVPEESPAKFETRLKLQAHLKRCVDKNRNGKLITRSEMRQLRQYLCDAGWDEPVQPIWQRILNDISSHLFPPRQARPFHLYHTLRILFEEKDYKYPNVSEGLYKTWDASSAHAQAPIVHAEYTPDTSGPLQKYLAALPLNDRAERVLWRIRNIGYMKLTHLPERVETGTHTFVLKQIHIHQKNHVMLYRKVDRQWINCNDDTLSQAKSLPEDGIYALIYEARVP